jgi:hypothetical protein
VDELLLVDAATAAGLQPGAAAIEPEIDRVTGRAGGHEALGRLLRDHGVSSDDLPTSADAARRRSNTVRSAFCQPRQSDRCGGSAPQDPGSVSSHATAGQRGNGLRDVVGSIGSCQRQRKQDDPGTENGWSHNSYGRTR